MKIQYKDYLHSSKESNAETLDQLMLDNDIEMSDEAQRNFMYSLYEVEFLMELETQTGDTKILEVIDE